MTLNHANQHQNHPYRVVGSRPIPVSLPSNKVDRAWVEWKRARRNAERVIEDLDFSEELLLSDLHKSYSTPSSDDAFRRSQEASYEQALLKQAVKLGAPKTIEFMSIAEGYQTYLLWLSGKYPKMDWEPVFQTFYREPDAPENTGKPLMGEWNLSEEQELLLTLRIHADLIPATGKPWGGRLLDSYDDDDHEHIETIMESLKSMHDCNPVRPIEFNLPQLRERANYYTTHIDKLALHSMLFDPATDPYEDSALTNQAGFSMSDLLAVESYYEREIQRLTGKPYVVDVDPMSGMKPVNSIAFRGSGSTATPDPVRDTEKSTPEVKEEAPKAIANTGENPENTITFGGFEDTQTPDHEKDTKQSIPEVNAKAPKAIANTRVDAKTLLESGTVFTSQEAAIILSLSVKQVTALIRNNELPAVKIGRGYRIKRENIEKLTEQRYKDPISQNQDKYDDDMGF